METPTRKEIRSWLEREIALGLETLPRAVASAARAVPSAARAEAVELQAAPPPPASKAPVTTRDASALEDLLVEPAIRAATSLDGLREVLGDCRRCKLCQGRTNIVFGVGSPTARLMFVGEGPGEDEDRQGIPFVGKAGALLTDIITKGMGLRRDDVYIANVVKCRPPENRNPEPDEIVACEPFLRRQIELVRPEVIVSLGNFATQALLGDRTSISRRRGRWHEYGGCAIRRTSAWSGTTSSW
jgi:DNA polymerase